MPLRTKRKNEHNQVALTVIYFLGSVASISALMSGFLIHEAVISDNAIDAAVVALIGQQVSITTLALGALGAMLSSTSPKPPPPPVVPPAIPPPVVPDGSLPVTIMNPPENPANVTEPIEPPVEPDVADVEPDVEPEPESDVEVAVETPPKRRRSR